jgi:hypothetical protein
MTAEFPDTSAVELEERRAREADEFAGRDLPDLEAERAQREDQLAECRVLCLLESRIISERLEALRAEIERRGQW